MKVYDLIKSGDIVEVEPLLRGDCNTVNFITPFGSWLHIAARAGNLELVEFLVEIGVDINLNEGVPKCSALANASSEGWLNIVEFLYNKGAILDVSDPTCNPLFLAIYGGHLEVVKFLVLKGINIDIKYTGNKMKNMGAYEFAIERGEIEIAEYLKHISNCSGADN